MKLALHRLADHDVTQKDAIESLGNSWVQFGQELWYTADPQREGLQMQAQAHPTPVSRENLYLIVQKGRLFQQEHPEVPVIADHGRFLLVELAPERSSQLQQSAEPCYAIRPLEDNQVVFDLPVAAAARASVAWVQKLVDQVSRADLEADLTHLVSYPTRLSTSDRYPEIAGWVQTQLQAMNYTTQSQAIAVNGGTSQNIIAEKPGSDGTQGIIVITAHLDSVNHQDGDLAIAPGADDNGSGSAGLLQIARVLKGHGNVLDLRFIFFGGEEQGLFGSKQYVASLPKPEQQRIKAMINMDMIGSLNNDLPTVLLEGAPLSQAVIDDLTLAAKTYTQLTVQISLSPFASDHVPFIDAGIPSALTIEGADGANDRIHSGKDTIDHINYELALEILRMNIAFVAMASALG